MTEQRVSKFNLPSTPTSCRLSAPCVYRDQQSVCDDPRTNKGNGDAACHRMTNKATLEILSTGAQP